MTCRAKPERIRIRQLNSRLNCFSKAACLRVSYGPSTSMPICLQVAEPRTFLHTSHDAETNAGRNQTPSLLNWRFPQLGRGVERRPVKKKAKKPAIHSARRQARPLTRACISQTEHFLMSKKAQWNGCTSPAAVISPLAVRADQTLSLSDPTVKSLPSVLCFSNNNFYQHHIIDRDDFAGPAGSFCEPMSCRWLDPNVGCASLIKCSTRHLEISWAHVDKIVFATQNFNIERFA